MENFKKKISIFLLLCCVIFNSGMSSIMCEASTKSDIDQASEVIQADQKKYENQINLPSEYLGPNGMDKLAEFGSNVALIDSYALTMKNTTNFPSISDQEFNQIVIRYNNNLAKSKELSDKWFNIVKRDCFNFVEGLNNYGMTFEIYADHMQDLISECIFGIDVEKNKQELIALVKDLRENEITNQKEIVTKNVDSLTKLRNDIGNTAVEYDAITKDLEYLIKAKEASGQYFNQNIAEANKLLAVVNEKREKAYRIKTAAIALTAVTSFIPGGACWAAYHIISNQADDLENQAKEMLNNATKGKNNLEKCINLGKSLMIVEKSLHESTKRGTLALEDFRSEWLVLDSKYETLYVNLSENKFNTDKWKKIKLDLLVAKKSWTNVQKQIEAIQKGFTYTELISNNF